MHPPPPRSDHAVDQHGTEPRVEVNPRTRSRVDTVTVEALYALQDHLLQRRAVARLAVVVAWLVLALATTSGGAAWAWGLPGLAGTALSLLHAQRRWVAWARERSAPRMQRAIDAVFPFVTQPHVNVVGVLECLGVLSLGLGTGWPGDVFADADVPGTRSTAALLLSVLLTSVAKNLVAQPLAWNVQPVRRRGWDLVRWLIPLPFFALFAVLLLAVPAEEGYRVLVLTAAAVGYAAAVHEGQTLDRWAVLLRRSATRAAVIAQDEDAIRLHSAAKNPAKALALDNLARIEDVEIRRAVADLVLRVSDAVDQVRYGRPDGLRNASEVVAALARSLAPTGERRIRVAADLEPEPLMGHDSVFVAALTSDLVTNALDRRSPEIVVRLSSAPTGAHELITLEVTCACGADGFDIGDDGSLAFARAWVRRYNGDLVVRADGPGAHSTIATWPTRVRAGALPPDQLVAFPPGAAGDPPAAGAPEPGRGSAPHPTDDVQAGLR
ncbi:hypothetical protein [Blastococcus sp. SYSU DS0533]